MAGYYLHSIDGSGFSQLTTSPTLKQGMALADLICESVTESFEEYAEDDEVLLWPTERDALAKFITERLAMTDWYSDLSFANAVVLDEIISLLQDDSSEEICLDFQCYDYESIYWDCADIAAAQGATLMAEPRFGSSGFRYFGKPVTEYGNYPMYSLFDAEQARTLLLQLQSVESYFAALPEGEGSPREQFFEGLLPPVKDVVENGRVLWVQTDT